MSRWIAICLAFILMCAYPAGAEGGTVLTVNGQSVSEAEALIYVLNAEKEYEDIAAYYEDFLGVNYWDMEYANGMTVRQMVKMDVFREIIMINVFYEMAVDLKMTLDEAEKSACLTDARAHYQSMSVANADSIDVNDLAKVFEKQKLADRVYSMLLANLDVDETEAFDSVNEEDYITYEIQYLFRQNTDFDENGASVPLSDEKRTQIMKALEDAKNEKNLEALGASLSEMDVFYGETAFVASAPDVDPVLLKTVGNMQPGDTSNVIETDFGLFLIRLTDDTDQTAYSHAVENAVYEMRAAAFEETYNELYAGAEYEINVSFWDSLTIGSKANDTEDID